MSLKEKMKKDEQSEHAAPRGSFFKFKEGKNKIRLLEEPIAIYKDYNLGICYTDCRFQGSMKYLTWIQDYADNSIKLMEIPYTVFQDIAAMEDDDDYAFTSFPMPYDVTINAEGAGSKEVKYSVVPRPKSKLDANIAGDLKKKKNIAEVIEEMKKKNKEKHVSDGTWDRLHADSDQDEDDEEGGKDDDSDES